MLRFKEAVVKYTLGIQKRPRLQPCECMKDELWLSLPGRQRDGPCTQEEHGEHGCERA